MVQSYAFCRVCNCDFSVSHGGRSNVSQHEKSAKHKRQLEAQKHAQAMFAFVTSNTTEANQIKNAEVKMAMLGALFPQLSLCEDRLRQEPIDYQVTGSKQQQN